MQDILQKISYLSSQKGSFLEMSIQNLIKNYEKRKNLYFPYLQEKDLLSLRFLIQILYEKIESLIDKYSEFENLKSSRREITKDYFEINENLSKNQFLKNLEEKDKKISLLQDEILEKNIKMNSLSAKYCILNQSFKDFIWMISETKREIHNLLNYNKDNLTINGVRKASLDNLLKVNKI